MLIIKKLTVAIKIKEAFLKLSFQQLKFEVS